MYEHEMLNTFVLLERDNTHKSKQCEILFVSYGFVKMKRPKCVHGN